MQKGKKTLPPLDASEKEEKGGDGENGEDGGGSPTRTWIEEVAVKMSTEDAEKLLDGTYIQHFKSEVLDVKRLKMLSPFDQKKHWDALQDRALDYLIEAITTKDEQMVSAIITYLHPIGTKPEKKKVIVELSKEKEELLNKYQPPPSRKEPPRSSATLLLERLGPLLPINQFNKEGLSPLHVAAGVGSVPIMRLLVDVWKADLNLQIWDYSVFNHALNSVSKGLSDEKGLDWLQIRGANTAVNTNSKIGKYTKKFVDIKAAKDKKIEDDKLELKKSKARAKKRARRKKSGK